MSDDQPPSRTAPRKRWVERISQLFSGEPHDLDDLLSILREARENHLLKGYYKFHKCGLGIL